MTFQELIFWFFSAVLIFAALRVITARNPVHAALFLVLAFCTAAAAAQTPMPAAARPNFVLLLIDDVAVAGAGDKTLNEIFTNGRQFGCNVILISQQANNLASPLP